MTEGERVRRLVDDRPALRPAYAVAWRTIARTDPAVQHRWATATLDLSNAAAGLPCIEAFWHLDPIQPGMLDAGPAAAALCRRAGARAALACLRAQPDAARLLGPAGLPIWWRTLGRLAHEAPGLIESIAKRTTTLLAGRDATAFADAVAAGLKATATDKHRRLAFFTEDGPLLALLARPPDSIGFSDLEPTLTAYLAGLWGGIPRLRALPLAAHTRPMIASGSILLPATYPGIPSDRTRALYRAAAAHAQAHLMAPPVLLPLAELRPIQRVLIGLVEDARVEALSITRFPGLRALWSTWHTATPRAGPPLALDLIARLGRALLDPAYADPDAFVQKGRTLFGAADPTDPAISRSLGGLLGNDLGQMRLQFNAKTYRIDPPYRDDNAHLWDTPDVPDDALALTVDAARPNPADAPATPRARTVGQDDTGPILATYPEWDAAARTLRPDWTIIRDMAARQEPALVPDPSLRAEIDRLVRSVVVGPRRRSAPREDGEELDLDRAVAASAARLTGQTPDLRLYRDRAATGRDLATLVILDISQSTAAATRSGATILDAQRIAVAALADALAASGDRFALRAFASAGRDDIRLTRLKDFDEPHGPAVHERLAALKPGLSTRLGAALRHAGAELAPLPTARKLLLVLTDGEPSDIDVPNPAELIEDASRAASDLRYSGIDVFGLVMDPSGAGAGNAIFGPHRTMNLSGLIDLPAQLTALYFRLAQR